MDTVVTVSMVNMEEGMANTVMEDTEEVGVVDTEVEEDTDVIIDIAIRMAGDTVDMAEGTAVVGHHMILVHLILIPVLSIKERLPFGIQSKILVVTIINTEDGVIMEEGEDITEADEGIMEEDEGITEADMEAEEKVTMDIVIIMDENITAMEVEGAVTTIITADILRMDTMIINHGMTKVIPILMS